jgi:hypothetical protein
VFGSNRKISLTGADISYEFRIFFRTVGYQFVRNDLNLFANLIFVFFRELILSKSEGG